jgi:2'-5' RNA ligase
MVSCIPQVKSQRRLRRSKRIGLAVPVRVCGRDAFNESFREFTYVVSVSAHGGLLALAARIERGQTILVQNRNTQEEQEFRVAHVTRPHQGEGKWRVGIEFAHGPVDFWKIYFPPFNAKRM